MLIYVNCVTINFDNKKISKMIKVTVQRKEKKWQIIATVLQKNFRFP